jgi:hypothetical protein
MAYHLFGHHPFPGWPQSVSAVIVHQTDDRSGWGRRGGRRCRTRADEIALRRGTGLSRRGRSSRPLRSAGWVLAASRPRGGALGSAAERGLLRGTPPADRPHRRVAGLQSRIPGRGRLLPSVTPGTGFVSRVRRGVEYIGIERSQKASALSRGNESASGCPVPGVAAGTTRLITTWQLDRQRLAAVTAAVAPGIRIADFSTGPEPRAAG